MKHGLWMLLCCIVPLLFLFLLPLLGLGHTAGLTGFLIVMLGCHWLYWSVRHHER